MTIEIKDKQLTISGATDTLSIKIVDGGIEVVVNGETWSVTKKTEVKEKPLDIRKGDWTGQKEEDGIFINPYNYGLTPSLIKEENCTCHVPVIDPNRKGICYKCKKEFSEGEKIPRATRGINEIQSFCADIIKQASDVAPIKK